MQVENVHERVVAAPVEDVRPWLDWAWSGGDKDIFPRDRLISWRERTRGGSPAAWSGGQTRFGHANLKFRLRRWDGLRWDADVLARRFRGEHGFTLEPQGGQTRIAHSLSGTVHGSMRLLWPLAVRPLHDWAVEAMFDRLEHALRTGAPPASTARPMGAKARLVYSIIDRRGHGVLSGQPRGAPGNWGATAEELRMRYGCDDLVVAPDARYFRATSVKARPQTLFRWLCQLRVAPYSYDWIDNWGRRSPRTLTPGVERLEVGMPIVRIFALESFETDRHLTLELRDPAARRAFGDLAVTYAVIDHGDFSRLVAKFVVRYPRTLVGRIARRALPWGDLVMARKQLLTLKRLAERHAGS